MRTDIAIGIVDGIIFLGVFQGLLLAVFFLKYRGRQNIANLYQGLFMLALSLAILEELLNNTGYIVRVPAGDMEITRPSIVDSLTKQGKIDLSKAFVASA